MQPLGTEDLVRLVTIMRSMHDVVTDADWQELARLDSERRALLKYDPSSAFPIDNDQVPANVLLGQPASTGFNDRNNSESDSRRESLIAEILSLDEQIISTVQNARQRLLNENRGLSGQRKAKELYAKTSSMT